MKQDLISIVLPVFNEQAGIANTIHVLEEFVHQQPQRYELITVNDGSKDKSQLIINRLQNKYSNLKSVQFSRNFGQDIAIAAGLRYSSGDAVVVMDADLQDPPSVIPRFIQKWRQGYQVVYGQRLSRDGENWFKKFTSKVFYRFLGKITNINIPIDTGDFRLMDRSVVNQLDNLDEPNQFFRGLVSWVGFKQTRVLYHRHARNAGQTKYSLHKMLKLAQNGITSFSSAPLEIISVIGGGLSAVGLMILGFTLFMQSSVGILSGIMMLLSGILMVSLGIIGIYLYQVVYATKRRPLYIVAHTRGFHNGDQISNGYNVAANRMKLYERTPL